MRSPLHLALKALIILPALLLLAWTAGPVAAQTNQLPDDTGIFKTKPQPIPDTATLPQTPTTLKLQLSARGFRALQSESPDRFRTGSAAALGAFIREESNDLGSLGTARIGRASQPDIAQRLVDVLLPYDADPTTLRLEFASPSMERMGTFDVRPIGKGAYYDPQTGLVQDEQPQGVQLDARGRDLSIYGRDAFWPSRPLEILSAGRLRQYQYVRLAFNPFRWNPSKKYLDWVANLSANLRWQRRMVDTEKARFRLSDAVLLDQETSLRFINWSEGAYWYLLGLQFHRIGTYDYVIVTTRNIASNSTMLSQFVTHKESRGYSVATVTVEAIDLFYSGSERADRIRAFLQDKYDEWGIQHVMLIGDPDPYDEYVGASDTVGSVPMKMAWPRGDGWTTKQDGEACPTDHYYGDLSDNWDVDGDGYAGSFADDYSSVSYTISAAFINFTFTFKWYGLDFDMEVRVGRIPFDDYNTVDDVLERIINYENADLASSPGEAKLRQRVYLATSSFASDTDYSYLGREIHNDFVDPAGLRGITLYEPTSPFAHDIDLQNEALITEWTATGAGLVVWAGHGSQTSASILYDSTSLMRQSEVANLSFNPRSFVFEGSCQNAWPENSTNLAHTLISEGAMVTIAGTRNSWYTHSQEDFGTATTIGDIGYWTSKSHISGWRAGYAILYMRYKSATFTDATWMQNLMTYNLYGDPTVVYTFN